MSTSPCNWPILYEEGEDCACAALVDLTPEQVERVEALAIELLWSWTGRRFGTCPTTVRPCRAECPQGMPTYWGDHGGSVRGGTGWVPMLVGGEWFNVGCGACGTSCTCAPDVARSLRLPGPVNGVTEIWIDGALLPPSAYELRDDVLYRVDGGVWPECNDEIQNPRTPESTAWEVTYERGNAVPMGGQVAAGVLVCELAKALCQDDTCQLPQRVQSITRQGVSMAILDNFDDLKEGRTGIWLVDAWVASTNAPRVSPPQVFSPDINPGRGRGTYQGLGRGRTR